MADNTVAPVEQVPTVTPISNTPFPEVMTPTTATSLVNQYGIDPTQVLSAENIAATTTAPTPAPDDLLGIRSQLYNEQGVNAAQTAYQNALKAASSATLGLNERLTGLRGRAVSMSKITGTQAQERAVSQGEIDALNESARIALADYTAKKGNADEMFQIRNQEISEKKQIMLQYPGAKVTFGDSMEQVSAKLSDYQKQQEKDAWKKTLKQMAMQLGVKTSGSSKDLEKRIRKANKATLDMAKEEHNLKMESMRMDILKTKASIAEGSSGLAYETRLDANGNLIQITTNKNTGEVVSTSIIDKKGDDKFSSSEIMKLQAENPGVDFDPNKSVAENLSILKQYQNKPSTTRQALGIGAKVAGTALTAPMTGTAYLLGSGLNAAGVGNGTDWTEGSKNVLDWIWN